MLGEVLGDGAYSEITRDGLSVIWFSCLLEEKTAKFM